MNLNDWRQSEWAGRLHQLGNTRSIPLWAVAVLVAAFVVLGALSIIWAIVGLAWLAAWCAHGLWSDARAAPAASHRAKDAASAPRDALWRQMLDAMPDAALLLDGHKNVLAANAAALSIANIVIGRNVSQLRAPDLLDGVDEALRTHGPASFAVQILVPVERHLAGMATPLRNAGPGEPALVIVLRDRTEIEQLAEMRADFVANASHELRTPLASLKGFIETLQGAAKNDTTAREQFLAIMQEQADRMTRLIDDLLSLSRIEMREHVAPTATIDLGATVDEAVSAMKPLADAAGIELTLQLPVEPSLVIGDRDEFAQMVQNLVQNAIKYGKPGGKVEVAVRRDGDRVLLTVADDGIGIEPYHLPRLTERFYRVNAKESRERGGTGLGLAIVKHIVNRHRGELGIESRHGQGSTFSVRLPSARVA